MSAMFPDRSARRVRAILPVLLAGTLVACQSPPPPPPPPQQLRTDRIILLPQADGTPSAVVVRGPSGAEVTLSQPYTTAHVSVAGVQTAIGGADETRARYPALFDTMPMQRVSYLVHFESGGERLTADSTRQLNRIAATVAELPAPEIQVVGHTDTVGSDSFNDELSLRRARIVRDRLIDSGVDARRIETVGRGRRELLVDTPAGVAEPRNRRVEIQVR